VALHRDDLTPEELALQEGLDRSWAYGQKALADPAFRAELEASIGRAEQSTVRPISKAEFLAKTEPIAVTNR
jgi:hypothetical protein